jgi:hypothetical protein
MCTVTVLRGADSTVMTMNRDEQWSRAPETPPQLFEEVEQGAWIGPVDGEKGGTWIGANAQGVVACILNGYSPADLELVGRRNVPSRGEIIPALLARPPAAIAPFLTSELDPHRYPSFTLLVLTPNDGVRLDWSRGGRIRKEALDLGWSMVSSSLWRTEDVLAFRAQRFEDWKRQGFPHIEGVPTFNVLELPGLKEWSPLMTRTVSGTRSVTQVTINEGRAHMRYWRRRGASGFALDRPDGSVALDLVSSTTA